MSDEITYLVTVEANWADEIDVAGLFLVTETEWQKYLAFLDDRGYVGSVNVGTNQEIEYEEVSDYLDCFKLKAVSPIEVEVFRLTLRLTPCTFYSGSGGYAYLAGRKFGQCLLPEFESEE